MVVLHASGGAALVRRELSRLRTGRQGICSLRVVVRGSSALAVVGTSRRRGRTGLGRCKRGRGSVLGGRVLRRAASALEEAVEVKLGSGRSGGRDRLAGWLGISFARGRSSRRCGCRNGPEGGRGCAACAAAGRRRLGWRGRPGVLAVGRVVQVQVPECNVDVGCRRNACQYSFYLALESRSTVEPILGKEKAA